MRAASVMGAFRPGSDGRCLMDVRHVVERRCAAVVVDGRWRDAWVSEKPFHRSAELANQRADALRAEGFTVRVRPIIL